MIRTLNNLKQYYAGPVPVTVQNTNTETINQPNDGNFFDGVGYLGDKLWLGLVSGIEGIWDYSAGGLAKLFGTDDWAEEQIATDWVDYNRADKNFNASGGWKTAGDVAGGIGTSLPALIATAAAAAITYFSGGTATPAAAGLAASTLPKAALIGRVTSGVVSGLGAAGNAMKESYQQTGELGAKEFGYGAMSGTVEGFIEAISGGLGVGSGQITKSITSAFSREAAQSIAKTATRQTLAKSLTSGFIGEAVEEGLTEFLSPYLKRMTYDPNAQNATPQEIGYAALIGGLSGAVMGGVGTTATNASAIVRGNNIVNKGSSASVIELSETIASGEAVNKTGFEAFQLVDNTLTELKNSVAKTNGQIVTSKQKMLLGHLQQANIAAVFTPSIVNNAINIYTNAERVAAKINAFYTDADGKPMNVTAEQIRANIDPKDNRSFEKALENDSLLRTLSVIDTVGQMYMDTKRFEEAALQGQALVDRVDINRFIEQATDDELKAVGEKLGISDWNSLTADMFNDRVKEYIYGGGASQYTSEKTLINEIKSVDQSSAKNKLPSQISMKADGTVRYAVKGIDIAVTKEGDSYRIFDYKTGKISKALTVAETNNALQTIKKNQAKAEARAKAKAKADTETQAREPSDTKSTEQSKQAESIDNYAKENISAYSKLSDGNRSIVRAVIRNGRAAGLSESDILSYARVSAHAGVNIEFGKHDKLAVEDENTGEILYYADGAYDRSANTIYVNPETTRSQEKLLIHELTHAIFNTKDGAVILMNEVKNMTDADKARIKARYKKSGYRYSYEFADEYQAHYAEGILTNTNLLERLTSENPSMVRKILNFFKGAMTTYKEDAKLSKAANRLYKQYKKMFDSFAQANQHKNERSSVSAKSDGAKSSGRKAVSPSEEGKRYSLSSMGYTFFGDENITVKAFENGKYKDSDGYREYVGKAVDIYMTTHKGASRVLARKEIVSSIDGIVRVAIAAKKAGYDIYDDARKRSVKGSKGRLMFSSLEPNTEYFTSDDISTICDKRTNFADIYDEIVRVETERNVPVEKRFFSNIDNYFVIHKILADKGLTTPCRQCYVESLRKNLAPMANAFLKLINETNPDNKKNNQLYHQAGKDKGKIKVDNAKLRERVIEITNEYGVQLSDITIETLSTADGLAKLKIQTPLLYEAFNSFYGQSKPKLPREATPFRFGELIALLTDDKGRIKKSLINQINSTGGFRLQSYSDFQVQNYVDVLQVLFEAGTLGLTGHAYTKVPLFLTATDGTNLKRNISIFMYKDGTEWKLDHNDSFPVETMEDLYAIVAADKTGNTGIIAVTQNDNMAAYIMANDAIGYGIPFHKSGIKMGVVRSMVVKEGGKEILGYADIKDHTRHQSETWKATADGHKANTKVKKAVNIYEFWVFENKDGSEKNDLIKKNLKAYIDKCEELGYYPKFLDYVRNNDEILSNVVKYTVALGYAKEGITIEDISFKYRGYTIPYGYHKFLGDFSMFDANGVAIPFEPLSLKNHNFEKDVELFKESETLRRNEILQQFANGEERRRYRESGLNAGQLSEIIRQKRKEVVEEIVGRDAGLRRALPESEVEVKRFSKDQYDEAVAYQRSFLDKPSKKNNTRFALPETDSEGNSLTAEQQEFFKDSKVRDENGNLLVVYHGTNADFTVFKPSLDGALGKGIYFTDNESVARGQKRGSRVIKSYLNITNPYIAHYPGGINQSELISKGYDGVYSPPTGYYVVFNPSQVKLTTNKNPTSNNDIRYAISDSLRTLGQYTDNEIKSIENTELFKVSRSYSDVKDFISHSLRTQTEKRLFLGKITSEVAAKIKELTGLDVNGKSVALSSSDIKHIFRKHGTNGTELLRGQIAVTEDNFENIIDTLIAPDIIEQTDERNSIGVVFKKNVNGIVTAITIVSEKKKALTLKSAWITKEKQSTSQSLNAEALNITSETLPRIKTVSDNSIPEKRKQVNQKTDKRYSLPQINNNGEGLSKNGDLQLLFDEEFYRQFDNEDRTVIKETLGELNRVKESDAFKKMTDDEQFTVNQKILALRAGYSSLYEMYVEEEKKRLLKDYEYSVQTGRDTRASGIIKEKKTKLSDARKLQEDINTATPLQNAQFKIIQATNPMFNETSVGIRSPKEIKTFAETINDDESFNWGDFTRDDAKKALKQGIVQVYSSYPIKNGVFVSTSYIQALNYAGNDTKKVHSRKVALDSVAWINGDEGQYAKVYSNIRFALKLGDDTVTGQVEETKNLVALHNLTESKLLKVLDLGGFPMPSIAITKPTIKHEGFGDITVVFGKDTVSPDKDSENKVYPKDAWSPVVPSSRVAIDARKVDDIVTKLGKEIQQYPEYLKDLREFFGHADSNGFISWSEYDFEEEEVGNVAFMHEGILAVYLKGQGKDIEPVYNISQENGSESVYDETKTNQKLKQAVSDRAGFSKWAFDQLSKVVSGRVFRKDTPPISSGTETHKPQNIYVPYTIENVVQAMKEESPVGNGYFYWTPRPSENIKASALEPIPSMSEIKKLGSSIKEIPHQQYAAIVEEQEAKITEIENCIMYFDNANWSEDFTAKRPQIREMLAVCSKVRPLTAENILRCWNSKVADYNIGAHLFDINIAMQVKELFDYLQMTPTTYFEAKPRRAVGFDEIKAVILPKTASKKLVAKLDENGIPHKFYTEESGRSEIIKNMDNIRFALPESDVSKIHIKEQVMDAWVGMQILFTNETAGIEKAGKELGIGNIEAITQNARSANKQAVEMLSGNQYRIGHDTLIYQGKGLIAITDPIMELDETAQQEFVDYLYHAHNISRMTLSERSKAKHVRSKESLRSISVEINKNSSQIEEKQTKNKSLSRAAKNASEKQRLKAEIQRLKEQNKMLRKQATLLRRQINSFVPLVDKPVTGTTADESRLYVKDYEAAHPEHIKTAEELWAFLRNLNQYRVDTGLISQDMADYLQEIYPNYVPTHREDVQQNAGTGSLSGRYNLAVKPTIKRATGSTKTLVGFKKMVDSIQRSVIETVKAGRVNQIANALYTAAEAKGDSRYIEIVSRERVDAESMAELESTEIKPKNNEITFFKDGERITMRVSKDVFLGFDSFSPSGIYDYAIAKGMRAIINIFKQLITSMNPAFLIRNTIRDFQDAGINTKFSKTYIKNYGTATSEIRNNGKMWQLYKAMGGFSSSVFDYEKGTVGRQDKRGFTKAEGKLLNKLMTGIENANAFAEQTPRLAEFISSIEAGNSASQAILDSADVTTNFGRTGKVTKILNATLIPFLNPSIQGTSKLIRNVTSARTAKQIATLIFKITLVGILPQMLNQFLYDDDEDYKNLRDTDKENNILLKVGDKFIKLPKGRVASVFAGLYNRSVKMFKGEGVEAWDGYVDNVIQQVTPVENFRRNITSPFQDVRNNITWYGSAIEGRQFDNVAPKDRYDESTSSIAILLGQAFNYSPKKIHYLLDQYSGVIGDFVLPATTAKAERGFLSGNFTIDPVTSNRLSVQFYKQYDEANYAKTAGDEVAAYKVRYLNKVQTAISEMYDTKSAIQNSDISDADKLAQTRTIQALINEAYKSALTDLPLFTNAVEATANVDSRYRFTEATRLVYGAERALREYDSSVYEKSTLLHKAGISYDGLYSYYFLTKDIASETDSKGNTISGSKRKAVIRAINNLDITKEQKLLLLSAKGYGLQDGDFGRMTAERAKRRLLFYILNLKSATAEEKAKLATMCGYTVKNGKVVTQSVYSLLAKNVG